MIVKQLSAIMSYLNKEEQTNDDVRHIKKDKDKAKDNSKNK